MDYGANYIAFYEPCLWFHGEAIGPSEPGPVHNLIGMTALVMWPKLLNSVKLDDKVTF